MSEQVQRRRPVADEQQDALPGASGGTATSATPQTRPVDLDAILDEIDAVLQSDAEDYVRGFVQKGGE